MDEQEREHWWDALLALRKRLAAAWQFPSELEGAFEELLRQLGAFPPVDALLELIPFVFPEHKAAAPSRRQSVACGIAFELLDQLSAERLIELDVRLRNEHFYAARTSWTEITPAALPHEPSMRAPMLALLTAHRSGYVRERAVRDLAAEAPAFGFPFVLLRANDWVDAVRRRAIFGISAILNADGESIVADALPLILKFEAFGRAPHEQLRTALRTCLESAKGVQALSDRWLRNRPRERRAIIFFLKGARQEVRRTFIERASTDCDPLARLWAARELEALECVDAEAANTLLARMTSDSSGAVRREALYGFVRRGPEQALPRLTAFVFDRARSVRHAARYYLRAQGAVSDFAAQYRAQLGVGGRVAHIVTAIAGLAETGSASDVPFLKQMLGHRSPKVVVALLIAILRLDVNGSRLHSLEATIDERASVRRLAIASLPRRLTAADAKAVLMLAAEATTRIAADVLVTVCARLPSWTELLTLLDLSSSTNEVVTGRAVQALTEWAPKGQPGYAPEAPDAATIAAVRQRLEKYSLPKPVADHVLEALALRPYR